MSNYKHGDISILVIKWQMYPPAIKHMAKKLWYNRETMGYSWNIADIAGMGYERHIG